MTWSRSGGPSTSTIRYGGPPDARIPRSTCADYQQTGKKKIKAVAKEIRSVNRSINNTPKFGGGSRRMSFTGTPGIGSGGPLRFTNYDFTNAQHQQRIGEEEPLHNNAAALGQSRSETPSEDRIVGNKPAVVRTLRNPYSRGQPDMNTEFFPVTANKEPLAGRRR